MGTNPRERQDTKLEERKVYINETTVTLIEIWKLLLQLLQSYKLSPNILLSH